MKDNEYKDKKFDQDESATDAPETKEVEEVVVPASKTASVKETVEEDPVLDEVYRVVNCANLNVRSHPRPAVPSDVIGSLPKGEIVHVDPKFINEDFKKVVKDGALVGYVSADYLEKI